MEIDVIFITPEYTRIEIETFRNQEVADNIKAMSYSGGVAWLCGILREIRGDNISEIVKGIDDIDGIMKMKLFRLHQYDPETQYRHGIDQGWGLVDGIQTKGSVTRRYLPYLTISEARRRNIIGGIYRDEETLKRKWESVISWYKGLSDERKLGFNNRLLGLRLGIGEVGDRFRSIHVRSGIVVRFKYNGMVKKNVSVSRYYWDKRERRHKWYCTEAWDKTEESKALTDVILIYRGRYD